MVKTTYYSSIRGPAQRWQGHSSAEILKPLFHIHLTPQVFSVLMVSLFDHKFLLRHAAMLLCLARTISLWQQRAKLEFHLQSTTSVNKKPTGNECMSTCSDALVCTLTGLRTTKHNIAEIPLLKKKKEFNFSLLVLYGKMLFNIQPAHKSMKQRPEPTVTTRSSGQHTSIQHNFLFFQFLSAFSNLGFLLLITPCSY